MVLARLLTWDATGVIVGDGSCGIGRVHRGDHASLFSTAPSAVRPSEGDVLVVIIIHAVSGPGPGRRATGDAAVVDELTWSVGGERNTGTR